MSFFPSYETARAFAEMRHGAAPFMHIVHPRPVAWTTLVGAIAAALGEAFVSLSSDPLLVWNYGVMGAPSFVAGIIFWLQYRHLDAAEDELNALADRHLDEKH